MAERLSTTHALNRGISKGAIIKSSAVAVFTPPLTTGLRPLGIT